MANEEQAALWDDVVGDAWVDNASTYDEMLRPFGQVTMDRLGVTPGDRVLDLGCGTGATTVELARRVTAEDADGRVVGVDLSTRMLAAARRRAHAAGVDTVDFVDADVQTADLGRGTFDRAFSRMGVMFFADPVAAFTNVARALRAGGRLAFCCFQRLEANPGVVLPVLAAAEILDLPPADPSLPGPFSLADAARTAGILEDAGFVDVAVADGPDQVAVSGVGDLRDLAARMLMQNPLTGPPFAAADDATRTDALDALATALAPGWSDGTLRLDMATWIVTAGKPG